MAMVMTNFNDAFLVLLENAARERGMSASEFIQQTMINLLEDEEDLREAEAEYEEYLKNPESFRPFKELEQKWLA